MRQNIQCIPGGENLIEVFEQKLEVYSWKVTVLYKNCFFEFFTICALVG